jgi:hypothetical protein
VLRRLEARLDQFLFAPTDARAVAWLRIALGLATPYFASSPGTPPRDETAALAWVHANIVFTQGYWLLILVVGLLLAAGWRPRLCSVLLLVLLLPLSGSSRGNQSRTVVAFALGAFAWLRSDAVPRPWERLQDARARSAGPCWPVRLLQLELTAVYGINALAKTRPSYLSGDALVDMSVALPNFLVDLRDGVLELGPLAIPLSLAAVLSAGTEWFLAFGFWVRRWRWAMAAIGIAFHWVLTFVLQIFRLDVATIFLYLVFLLPLVRTAAAGDEAADRSPDAQA